MKIQSETKEKVQSAAKWTPPRGIRLLTLAEAPNLSHGVQWRVEGVRKTKGFPTKAAQEAFARSLAGSVKLLGVEAFRLGEDEARAWRGFTTELAGAPLDDVLACWRRHGAADKSTTTVSEAVRDFLAAK